MDANDVPPFHYALFSFDYQCSFASAKPKTKLNTIVQDDVLGLWSSHGKAIVEKCAPIVLPFSSNIMVFNVYYVQSENTERFKHELGLESALDR
jgi:hypothetical protein